MIKYVLILLLINKFLKAKRDNWGSNSQVALITDMSESCSDDLHTDVYLPFGMGVADANIIIVSDNDLYPNCIITFHTVGVAGEVYLIVVIEFPDHTEGPRNACQSDGSTIKIKEANNSAIDVCNAVNKLKFGYYSTAEYSILSNSSNISVIITSKTLFETVKITVTSARKLKQYEKCNDSEVSCLVSNASVCVSRELQCDENINCGSPSLNDEDIRICDEARYNRLWLVVLCGTIMVMIIVLFLIHLLRTCLPSVPDSFFIFNEDEDNKLILSTKFIAPPESLRQTLPRQMPAAQSSSFKFKSVPITSTLPDVLKDSRKVSLPNKENRKDSLPTNKENISLPSSDLEVELESHLYKHDAQREVGEILEDVRLKVEEDAAAKLSSKKPRFQDVDFINIMDRIELPTQLPKDQQNPTQEKYMKTNIHKTSPRKSNTELEQQPSSRKERKNRSTTFSVQPKQKKRLSEN